jgi:hypothetical protein
MGGVADGVGAWNTKEKGRPGLWARLLMHYWAVECEERMKLWKVDRISGLALDEDEEEVDIVQMLHRAYLRTKIEMENTGGWVGSTTATVGLLQRSNLHIANVSPILRWVSNGSWVIQGRSSFEGINLSSARMKNSIGMIVLTKSAQIQQIPQ